MATSLTRALITTIGESIGRNKLVRRNLPDGSRLHIDRQLPFLCVYRRPLHREDAGTERLLLGEAAYLLATSRARHYTSLVRLIGEIAQRQSEIYGAFLLFELWSAENTEDDEPSALFRIHAPRHGTPQRALEKLESALLSISIDGKASQVELVYQDSIHPPDLKPLLHDRNLGFITIGLEVKPIYRDANSGELFPFKLRELHHDLAKALKRTFYTFTHSHTRQRPAHFYELGRHAMTRAVKETDNQLAEISQSFDLLLHVTPVNAPQEWEAFRRSRFQRSPEFLYRSRPIDPALMKRKLFSIPIEQIEDPTLAYIYTEKQNELERQITLVADRNTPRFLYGSRQLYGDIEPDLLAMAHEILQQVAPHLRDDQKSDFIDAEKLAEIAREEIQYYRNQDPSLVAKIEVRNDITGILVSRGNLLIGHDTKVPRSQIEATLSHEIGTHILTYHNGQQQPLKEFYSGMAGYEPLQEGLAVLSEYLVGGLSRSRLRLLAGRVIAVQHIHQGADFIETFRVLSNDHGFSQQTAYTITMRVYRGGGYTKDAVYLRGLTTLLLHLAGGGELDTLLLGKISDEQLALVEELGWRKVLTPAVLQPRYLDKSSAQQRLARLQKGISVIELISEAS
ncbi:MAG: flavohemoglobin expression-modulating QEGLA motif protein [Gammaproteobacteria bacterium]|nr:flavohemoglobin expression-modulating QEGLA motif protein [Gammaproteobacteria bacterium]